jgi:superfamily II DNA or RNA helicase
MRACSIVIKDHVNCMVTGLDPKTVRKMEKHLTFDVPGAFHMPAFKLGRWNGKVSLFENGWTFTNLLDEDALDIIGTAGYDIDIVDQRRDQVPDPEPIRDDEFAHLEGAPVLRDYQVHAVNLALRSPSGVFRMATGAGKSYVCAAISKRFMPLGRVLVIVPSIDLVTQTADSFRTLGISDVGEFYGSEKVISGVTITTWQSLDNFPEIAEGVVCVICDEAHKGKASVLMNLLCSAGKNIPRRYGFTGTLPDNDLDRAKVLAALGPVLFEKSTWELQQSGVLAASNINVIQTLENRPKGEKLDYDVEYRQLTHDPKRLQWLAELITDASASGNTFVLVKNIETGRLLERLLPGSVFLSGGTKKKARKQHYDSFGELDGKIVIATKGIASTGIDIPRIFNLFLFEAGKNFIEILQSVGRGLRKADDKDTVEIYDVCSDMKFSKRHMRQRMKYYDDQRLRYVHLKVDYR